MPGSNGLIDPGVVEDLARLTERELGAVQIARAAIARARSEVLVGLGALRHRPGPKALATKEALVEAVRALERGEEELA